MPTTIQTILSGGFQDPQALIRAYISAHPDYEPLKDLALVDDRPSLSLVAVAKMQAEDTQAQDLTITLESALQGVVGVVPFITKGLDLNEAINGGGLPASIGFGIDAGIQLYADREMANGPEKIARALIVGLEGASVQSTSLAVIGGSGALGLATGPADVAIMFSAYAATNVGLTLFYKNFNENKLFPYLSERFD